MTKRLGEMFVRFVDTIIQRGDMEELEVWMAASDSCRKDVWFSLSLLLTTGKLAGYVSEFCM